MTIEQDIEEITKVIGWSIPHVRKDGIRRYNSWAGNPEGNKEDPQKCIVNVAEGGRSMMSYQCNRKRGKGPGGLLCGVHLRQMEKVKMDREKYSHEMQLEKEGKTDRRIGTVDWIYNETSDSMLLVITLQQDQPVWHVDSKFGLKLAEVWKDKNGKWKITLNGLLADISNLFVIEFDTIKEAQKQVENRFIDFMKGYT